MLIGGEEVAGGESFTSWNPSRRDEAAAIFPKAGQEHVQRAVAAAAGAFPAWSRVAAATRSEFLLRAAAELRRRKHEFSAWMTYEAGKTWPEADADTAEAIDFLEFYARENLRLSGPQPVGAVPGERTSLVYLPLGVCAVVPPWNFPLAILVGMTSAALVTGNTVVLKPSSDTPTIAHEFVSLMRSLDLPDGVLNFVTGSGGEIGDALVSHPQVRMIAFTGSKAVGLRINELAARPQPGQRWIKRVIVEMGGKDAIIVDREADLDLAAQGVSVSAFGYQGQKCSACSRVIVDAAVYDAFVEKLLARVARLKVGPAVEPGNDLGPVINARAQAGILDYIEIGKREGRLAAGGAPAGDGSGFFLAPAVFLDVAPGARIAQEEIFGPVLAVIRARDFDEALRIGNDTEYGLTGSVYTRNREKIERARREFFVGNLYFNRKCTGALVGGHPFGGFNMSGTDSKAGGQDYLLLFLQAQSIAEKIVS
jgi:1-pyrroline-5-carboxylate dehydrogenase